MPRAPCSAASRATQSISNAAIGMAKSLFHSFAMPQQPDIVRVSDDQGNELFCGAA